MFDHLCTGIYCFDVEFVEICWNLVKFGSFLCSEWRIFSQEAEEYASGSGEEEEGGGSGGFYVFAEI